MTQPSIDPLHLAAGSMRCDGIRRRSAMRRAALDLLYLGAVAVLLSCNTVPIVAAQHAPFTLTGTASYDDGTPAHDAVIALTDLESMKLVSVLTTNTLGFYQGVIPAGKYAFAVASGHGFAWIETQEVPSKNLRLTLSRSCHPLAGKVDGEARATRMNLERQSLSQGDTFVAPVQEDGSFSLCLPGGQYRVFLTGMALSVNTKLDLPTSSSLHIRSIASHDIKQGPSKIEGVDATLEKLVSDIIANNPKIIGLGEATHGTSEFFSSRGALTLELIRRADVRLLLFEFDAIASATLDDYVNGADVDPAKAVADLGFWISDTYEFLRFLSELREYNAATTKKVRIWGIDLQNTTHPVDVLIGHADQLSISAEEQATLKRLGKKGQDVQELSAAQRSGIDALLSRLRTPRSSSKQDVSIALAARSLASQLDYWTGDMGTWLRKRRDIGMASLATFLVTQVDTPRACLWAHDSHISKQPSEFMLGYHLASAVRYYSIGFYLYQGSTRAVDTAGEIGVISYPIPVAPKYTLEGVVMDEARMSEIAWLPLRNLPPRLRKWFETPRFSRELGAVYMSEDDMMTLHDNSAAFDAVVVIQTGHDSSPTPTGVRVFKH